jgi:hypothetical protein
MNLNDLKCCMPNKPEHFVRHQKILSCGHPVCSSCCAHDTTTGIKCARCNVVNQSELSDLSSFDLINKLSEKYIESNLVDFHKLLYAELKETIENLEGKRACSDRNVLSN